LVAVECNADRSEVSLARTLLSLGLVAGLVLGVAPAAFAAEATEGSATTVTVNASIALSGIPATIAFPAGIVGDLTSAPDISAVVTTNNATGYSLAVTTSALTGASGSPQTIAASAVGYAATTGVATATATADGAVVDASTALTLGGKSSMSDADGDIFVVTPTLTIPFVKSDDYSGTASFVASTL
jgi:hypothetical protein